MNKISLIIAVTICCFIFILCGCDKDKTNVANSSLRANSSQTSDTQSDITQSSTNNNSSSKTSSVNENSGLNSSSATDYHSSVSDDSNSYSETTVPFEEILSEYKPPADIIEISPSEEDPSNEEIKFEYDDSGRISKCYYDINNLDMYQAYSYTDDSVHIYTFSGSIIIDDITFEVEAYDESIGFLEYNGYYFKNVKVKG